MQFAKNVVAQAAMMKVEMVVVVAIAVVTVVVVVRMLWKLFPKFCNKSTFTEFCLIRPKSRFRVELLASLAIGVVRQYRNISHPPDDG